jgi:hypothetical protein
VFFLTLLGALGRPELGWAGQRHRELARGWRAHEAHLWRRDGFWRASCLLACAAAESLSLAGTTWVQLACTVYTSKHTSWCHPSETTSSLSCAVYWGFLQNFASRRWLIEPCLRLCLVPSLNQMKRRMHGMVQFEPNGTRMHGIYDMVQNLNGTVLNRRSTCTSLL